MGCASSDFAARLKRLLAHKAHYKLADFDDHCDQIERYAALCGMLDVARCESLLAPHVTAAHASQRACRGWLCRVVLGCRAPRAILCSAPLLLLILAVAAHSAAT